MPDNPLELLARMMGKSTPERDRFRQAVEQMSETLRILEPLVGIEPVPPEAGCTFETLNGSVVLVVKIDNDGDGVAVVLKGGHGLKGSSGEEPGERYFLDPAGYYKESSPGPGTVMSLRRKMGLLALGGDVV